MTLVELLVVVAILMLMMAAVVPAVTTISRGRSLVIGGNQIANLANLARENALSNNSMTALIVPTDINMEKRNRMAGLFQLLPSDNGTVPSSANWTQISSWETLPQGVVIDPGTFTFNDSSDPASTPGVPMPPFPPIRYGAGNCASYRYVVFLPGGGLLSGSSTLLRMVEGFLPAGSSKVSYTHPANGGLPANYYDITLIAATGRLKIDRP